VKVKANKATAWLTAAGASAASMAFAFPVSAFAAEEKTGIAVILPDPVEFVPMLIAFLILAVVLGKFGWPMFEGMLEKREKTIADALEQSEKARQESERVLEEYKRELADAKSQAAQIIAEAKQTGENTRAQITKQAQDESAAMIEKARGAIEAEKNAALRELQGSIADISTKVCERLIGEELTTDEHRKVIERYVNEAGSFHAE
jgi:F-type H+-transporting ATPase subunit b